MRHIVIAGNIGAGKSTLAAMLARRHGWTLKKESVVNNPYLSDYYADMPRWSLNLEVFFLKERFRDLLDIANGEGTVIQDRSIYEGVYIFAANNHDMGNMSDRDFSTYMGLFQSMMMAVRQPDLMVYLRSGVPHLVEHIRERGRDYEMDMRLDYLQALNDRYDRFFASQYDGPTLTIDVDNRDFLNNIDDFAFIDRTIGEALAPRLL